jgi:hypothetical protein
MAVDELLALYDLDPAPALAPVRLADCDLEFHRGRATGDIWCIAVGPLGAFPPMPVATQEMLTRVRTSGPDPLRPRGRTVAGLRVDIDENVGVVLRARGQRLEGTYVHADGSPFGGLSGGLPSGLRPSIRQRIGDFFSGRRGAMFTFGYDSAHVEATRPKRP